MISQRQLFLRHLAQTSDTPLLLEIEKARGVYLFDKTGKKYIDLISGISVSNLGHCNIEVNNAIKKQLKKHSHLMVYGEYVQSPQVKLAQLLSKNLPHNLNSVYYVNSGSEAVEGALKLAKRYTNRYQIFAFKNAYHGSTQGALSVMGEEKFKRPFRPLLPSVYFLNFNDSNELDQINNKTAAVIIEPIQGEAGVILPDANFLLKLRKKCTETGAMLIFDEIQTGIGRTGKLFAFEHYNIIPDIITIGKAFGGGMPLGAFISSKEIMQSLSFDPILGHITTFGGHPVSCAAALASLKIILKKKYTVAVNEKENLFRFLLKHPKIKEIRGKGLFLAIELHEKQILHKVINLAITKGVIIDWFLLNDSSIRIAPPLIINNEQIKHACNIIITCLNEF